MSDQKNLILAVVLSLAILMGFQYFYEVPKMEAQQEREAARLLLEDMSAARSEAPAATNAPRGLGGAVPDDTGVPLPQESGTETIGQAPAINVTMAPAARIPIRSDRLHGSISLRGARIDNLILADYHETIDPESPDIVLLAPTGTENPYYAEFGWTKSRDTVAELPDRDTLWQTNGSALSPETPLTLTWNNGQGLRFTRTYALDENYMITVAQQVTNAGLTPVTLFPYGLISRTGTPKILGYYILHEGPLGVFGGTLEEADYTLVEADYDELAEDGPVEVESIGGWLGFTDKYWLTALVPDQSAPFAATIHHDLAVGGDKYQVDYLLGAHDLAPGGSVQVSNRLFAGAKQVNLLNSYEDDLNIKRFDLVIDWGWFPFLTKPIFFMLDYFNKLIGNFGIAILLLTILIKLLFFPLANKSYESMSKMRKLQPEIAKLKERYPDDRVKQQQEQMELFKKEQVNPMAGCLPIVIQIPVFFALYKVLFVTIEMRHAPFFGWIHDLSAPDPLTFMNLFGVIPWDPPTFLAIGLWPLMMGISMYLQQKLNPQPTDPVQAKVFMIMPVMFTFLLASFPAGLVIYWTWNNVLSITQQWVIMKRMGVKI